MGQYYKPINTENYQWLYSHDYANGLKLMEHSLVGNNFVGAVMTLLSSGNRWYKKPIVWAGDYYGDKEGEGEIAHYYLAKNGHELQGIKSMDIKEQMFCVLVNHTKKEYVVYFELTEGKYDIVNPLPLLTALGNGRGGGDYDGNDMDKIGIWAGDILSVQKIKPKKYKKIKVNFRE